MGKTATTKPTLKSTLEALRKKGNNFGFEEKARKFYSTGNVAIDAATGGGLPVGKLIEIYGKTGSGKTTLALQTAAGLMAEGKTVIWLDYERAFDEPYARALGIDTHSDQFIYNAPTSIEHGINVLRPLIETGEVALVVIDSIARMTTEAELVQEMGQVTVADKAKALYKMCRLLLNPMDDNDCTMVVLNHWLDVINTTMPGAKSKTTPGGNAVPYFSQLRLQCEQYKNTITEQANVLTNATEKAKTGADIKITVTKNRSAAPYKTVIVHNEFGTGFSQLRSALEIAKSYGLVDASSAWTNILSPKLSDILGATQYNGFDKFESAVKANSAARGMLISLAHEVAAGNWKQEVSEDEKQSYAEENSDTA